MTTDQNGVLLELGDYVFGPDGHEWKITALGGPNKDILHLQRTEFRVAGSQRCRLSRYKEAPKEYPDPLPDPDYPVARPTLPIVI